MMNMELQCSTRNMTRSMLLRVCSVTLNTLEHLGNQRFALPPFSEHFQRWMERHRDAIVQTSKHESQKLLTNNTERTLRRPSPIYRVALKERTDTETTISNRLSDAQRQIAKYENELAKLDQDYKTRNHEVRRRHEQSFEKIRAEINTLDEERLRILHTKPSLLKKLFRRSEDNLEEKTNVLRSKKNAFDDRKQLLKQDLETQQTEIRE